MAKRKWLDDEEKQAWYGLISTMALLDAALDRQLQRTSGMSHAQYAILAQLSAARGATMHMSDLASLTSSSNSRLSHAVSRMEEDGWVARTRCPDNGRAVHATLTPAGMTLMKAAAPGHVAEVRRLLFNQLNRDQVGQLVEITSTVLETLEAESGS